MRILIANDDGIYSPGIATLAEIAAKFGDVRVVAPERRAIFRRTCHYSVAAALL